MASFPLPCAIEMDWVLILWEWLLTRGGCVDTWIGMAFVLGGIALCVQSKNVNDPV